MKNKTLARSIVDYTIEEAGAEMIGKIDDCSEITFVRSNDIETVVHLAIKPPGSDASHFPTLEFAFKVDGSVKLSQVHR